MRRFTQRLQRTDLPGAVAYRPEAFQQTVHTGLSGLLLALILLAGFAAVLPKTSAHPRVLAEQKVGKILNVQHEPVVRAGTATPFNFWFHEPRGHEVTLSISSSPGLRIDSFKPRPASWTQNKQDQVLIFDTPAHGDLEIAFSDVPTNLGRRDLKVVASVGEESRATLDLKQWVLP